MMIKHAYLATVSPRRFLLHRSSAAAQDPHRGRSNRLRCADGRTTVYQAAFFAQFAPRTALDIAKRVPGFTLDLGATQTNQGQVDVRGFAGTAGNVVINGARPSSKAETLDVTLAQSRPSRCSGSSLVRATSSAPTIPARARCSTSHVGQRRLRRQLHRRRPNAGSPAM